MSEVCKSIRFFPANNRNCIWILPSFGAKIQITEKFRCDIFGDFQTLCFNFKNLFKVQKFEFSRQKSVVEIVCEFCPVLTIWRENSDFSKIQMRHFWWLSNSLYFDLKNVSFEEIIKSEKTWLRMSLFSDFFCVFF